MLKGRLLSSAVLELSLPPSVRVALTAPGGQRKAGRGEFLLADRTLPAPLTGWRLALATDDVTAVGQISALQRLLLVWGVILSALTLALGVYATVRLASREIRAARRRQDFVSNVSHELKTPLTSIRMFIETLQTGRFDNPEEEMQYLSIIGQESERLNRLVERVLNFTRMEEGRKVYRMHGEEPAEIIRGAVDMMQAQFDEAECDFEMHIDDDLPPVEADRDAVSEVIINLLSNALRYTGSEKRIRLDAAAASGEVRIAVTDNGIGLSADERKRVFNKFYRAENERTLETEGTGLGLAISKHIAEAHRGRITVDSMPGEGSTFTLILPAGRRSAADDPLRKE